MLWFLVAAMGYLQETSVQVTDVVDVVATIDVDREVAAANDQAPRWVLRSPN